VHQGEGVDFGVVCHHWPNGFNGVFCNRNVMFHWLSEDVLRFESNWQKCNSWHGDH